MAQQLADRRDMDFVIWEQLNSETLLSDDLFPGFNKKTCYMLPNESSKLTVKEVLPTLKDADEIGVQFKNGEVKVPESFHRPFKLMREGDWCNLMVPEEMGGQGAPPIIGSATTEYFFGANWALTSYVGMGNSSVKIPPIMNGGSEIR